VETGYTPNDTERNNLEGESAVSAMLKVSESCTSDVQTGKSSEVRYNIGGSAPYGDDL
jgi:hypothetical protein